MAPRISTGSKRHGCGPRSPSSGTPAPRSQGSCASLISTLRRRHRARARPRYVQTGDSCMPVKRRVPKDRNPAITDEAVTMFARLLELQKLGVDEAGYDADVSGHAEEREEFLETYKALMWGVFNLV